MTEAQDAQLAEGQQEDETTDNGQPKKSKDVQRGFETIARQEIRRARRLVTDGQPTPEATFAVSIANVLALLDSHRRSESTEGSPRARSRVRCKPPKRPSLRGRPMTEESGDLAMEEATEESEDLAIEEGAEDGRADEGRTPEAELPGKCDSEPPAGEKVRFGRRRGHAEGHVARHFGRGVGAPRPGGSRALAWGN